MYGFAPTYPSFQMVSNVSVELCHVDTTCSIEFTELPLFLTVEEHSGETANTDVQGCRNP
jgi:hypothetical protein